MCIRASMHSNFGKMRLFYFCFAFCIVIVPQMVQPKQSDSLHFFVPGPERFFEKVRVCTIPPTPTTSRRPTDLRVTGDLDGIPGSGRYVVPYLQYIWVPEF